LSGMVFCREALKNTGLNEEQMRQVHVADSCHHQLNKILADLDQDNIIDKYCSYLLS
jgi:phytochrome A